MKKTVIAIFLIIVLAGSIHSGTSFKKPSVDEVITMLNADIIRSLVTLMIRTKDLSKVDLIKEVPCADVWVSSSTIDGVMYWGLSASTERCKEEVPDE